MKKNKEQLIDQQEQLQMDLEVEPIDNSKYLIKSNNLIESSYKFNINEFRLTYLAIKKLTPIYIKTNIKKSEMRTVFGHETFKDIKISVNEFKREFDIKTNNVYEILRETTEALQQKQLKYYEGHNLYVNKNWVITSKYDKLNACVYITFHTDLIFDLLIFKERFTKVSYNSVQSFKKTYSYRLYELLKCCLYNHEREITLEDLRLKLCIDENKYQRFTDFRKKVLDASIEEINQSSEIYVTYEARRVGRSIGSIYFHISENKNNKVELKENQISDVITQEQIDKMTKMVNANLTGRDISVITEKILEAIKYYDIDMGFYDYFQEKIDVLNEYSKIKPVKNYVAFLIQAIQGNWKRGIVFKSKEVNGFNNFESRGYTQEDYDTIEKMALGWADDEEEKKWNQMSHY